MTKVLLEKAERLQEILVAHATGKLSDEAEYLTLRAELISHPVVNGLLPTFVTESRSLDQYWHWIKGEYSSYAERRKCIWQGFAQLLTFCEKQVLDQASASVSLQIEAFGAEQVLAEWQKALARKQSDPEGAITIARSLLESVCKHILEEHEIPCEHAYDLPALYKQTAKCLNLSPNQHSEEVFRHILGGCASVVNGLSSIRNQFGDSHGKTSKQFKPAPRHAELAVNLAGSMASFLIQTHLERRGVSFP